MRFLIFLVSMMMAGGMGFEFMPEADQGSMTAAIELQTGLRVDETTKVARKIDAFIEENMPEAKFYYTSSGSDDQGGMMSLFMESGSHRININFTLTDLEERDRDVWELANQLSEYLETIPEIVNFDVVPNGGMGGTTENNVVVEIFGYDFETTSQIANCPGRQCEQHTGSHQHQCKPGSIQATAADCARPGKNGPARSEYLYAGLVRAEPGRRSLHESIPGRRR